jgi:flagellar biosynthesis protein FlhF
MKIKRFFSQDMRSAIRLVREELGADAVILSNDRVNGGVEIVAAVDYDEAILNPPASPDATKSIQNNQYVDEQGLPQRSSQHNNAQRSLQRSAESDYRQAPKHSGSDIPQTATNTTVQSTETSGDKSSIQHSAARQAANRAGLSSAQSSSANQGGSNDYTQGQGAQDLGYTAFHDDLLNEQHLLDADDYDADEENANQHINTNLQNRIDSAFKPPSGRKDSPYMKHTDSEKTNASVEFYSLDEALPDELKINDSLYDLDQAHEYSGEVLKGQQADNAKPYSVWSQEPTLMAMRNEITNLRGMLEQQLTGLAWNDLKKNNPQRAKLIKQLLELGFSPELADQVIQKAEGQGNNQNDSKPQDYRRAWQLTLSSLAEKLPIKDDDVALSGGVVSLVGATGVGKTTTIAKLAARYALRHGRNNIVLITTDTYRIGALEQLRTYGRILGIPVKIAHNKKQLQDLLKMLSDKKFVLIDTAGMGQRDVRLMEQFSVISECAMGLKTLLVLSSTTHRAALDETIRSFSNVEINGCILTKLDETTNLGGALSVVTEHQLPVAYISDGQRVPEDLHLARAHTLINRCVSIARRANQPLDNDSLELAYSRMPSHVSA